MSTATAVPQTSDQTSDQTNDQTNDQTRTPATDQVAAREQRTHATIPLHTVMGVELRKMFDTRSGFWMLASIGILSVLATGAVVLWAPADEQTYSNFAAAIGIPMSIVLPMIAVLSITSEWSQRTGLTTFTLVPHRSRVVMAKMACAIAVGVASMAVALSVGVLGNIVGSALAGVDTVWDFSPEEMLYVVGGNVLGILMGFTLGVLARNSAAAIVGYFVYAMVLPTISGILAAAQEWYRNAQPWVDFQYNQTNLFNGDFTGADWAHLAVTGAAWLVLPLAFGLWRVLRSEVK